MKIKQNILASSVALCVSGIAGNVFASSELSNISLEDLLTLDITVASNVVTDARKQPVSVTTITSDKIAMSGARNLSEVLAIYVPGYFEVEDQDDTISGFRGLVPDNNSKVMMLLNGQSINAEWFWGLSDAVLHGIDLDYIERVEVIRGPGSVTLGSGALLGVINIVTKKGTEDDAGATVKVSIGNDNLDTRSMTVVYGDEDSNGFLYASTGRFDGQQVRNEGWPESRVDQGISIFDRNHGLKSSEFTNFFGNVRKGNFEANFYSFDNVRDNYFWERDRDIIEQKLDGVSASYTIEIDDMRTLKLSGFYNRDDYGLRSKGNNDNEAGRLAFETAGSSFSSIYGSVTGWADGEVTPGLTMGGTREERNGVKGVFNIDEAFHEDNKLAVGFDYTNIKMGRVNADGNNFIINEEIQSIGITPVDIGAPGAPNIIPQAAGNVNDTNTWVKEHNVYVKALFLEDFYSVDDELDVFFAARYDDHSDWGTQLSPRVGALYDIDETHLFRFTYQTGFRGAVGVQFAGGFVQDGFLAEENFDDFEALQAAECAALPTPAERDACTAAAVELNPVEPETIQNFEFAYTYTEDGIRANAILFYNIVEDILAAGGACLNPADPCADRWGTPVGTDVAGTWGGNWYYQNLEGELTQIGLELELDYTVNDNWTLSASHAHVGVQDADDALEDSIYVVGTDETSLYPENVTRFQATYVGDTGMGEFSFHYNHTYYWEFINKAANDVNGNHMANVAFSLKPKHIDEDLKLTLKVKNLLKQDKLTPMNVTGANIPDGVPGLEDRTYWLDVEYKL